MSGPAAIPAYSLKLPRRVVFGRGSAAQAAAEVAGFGRQILLVRGRSSAFAGTLLEALQGAGCGVLTVISRGEPTLAALDAAVARARLAGVEAVVAVGGGSVLDLGKAAAAMVPQATEPLDHLEVVGRGLPLEAAPLPFIALPTTAGTGAEATRNAVIGVPAAQRKVSLRDDRMLADLALVDPALTDAAPRAVTLASGLDAVTQVIEPYLSAKANPVTDALCRAAIPMGLAALARLMEAEDPAARDAMAHVSLTGGIALSNAGLGAVHGLAGPVGGRSPAPHGAVCGRLLPGVLSANAAAVAEAGGPVERFAHVSAWIAAALDVPEAQALAALSERIDAWGLPRLGAMGLAEAAIAAIAEDAGASSSMKANPVRLSPAVLAEILGGAL